MPETKTGEEVSMPNIIATINLGPNDEGLISSDHLPAEVLDAVLQDSVRPEFQKKPTNRWRCVDGRVPDGGLEAPEGYSDPQLAGGLSINETSVDIMTGEADDSLSATVARNTRKAIEHGQQVVVHGDNHAGRSGCGANKFQREMLLKNAENAEVIVPVVVEAIGMAGLAGFWDDAEALKADINGQIEQGHEVAQGDSFWDIAPDEVADAIVANGGAYEELIEDHLEVFAKVELETETTLDEPAFMSAHSHDGKPIEAFVASLGLYAKYTFERASKEGRSENWAARRVVATLLAHVGTLKKLTSNIPIVISK